VGFFTHTQRECVYGGCTLRCNHTRLRCIFVQHHHHHQPPQTRRVPAETGDHTPKWHPRPPRGHTRSLSCEGSSEHPSVSRCRDGICGSSHHQPEPLPSHHNGDTQRRAQTPRRVVVAVVVQHGALRPPRRFCCPCRAIIRCVYACGKTKPPMVKLPSVCFARQSFPPIKNALCAGGGSGGGGVW
jgi:hypothetical protein